MATPRPWQPADRWVFDWTVDETSGTKTVEVIDLKEINGVAYYAVTIGDARHYYTRELSWAAAVRDGTVEARSVPPEPWFAWPLDVGRQWRHDSVFEDRRGKRARTSRFAAVGVDTVEVPAGRFVAVKIARETMDGDTDEYWFAPDVGWYVRWIGRRGAVRFEERLREYRRGTPVKTPTVAR